MRRTALSTVLHIAAAAAIVASGACASKETANGGAGQSTGGAAGATGAAGASSTMRVALLTPGSIADQSWNGGAYAGLLRIRDSLGARTSHIQTKSPAEIEENFRQYG